MEQENLRLKVKLAKALNDDLYYKDFADYLGINEHSFYNFLYGFYELSSKNAKKLEDIVNDLID